MYTMLKSEIHRRCYYYVSTYRTLQYSLWVKLSMVYFPKISPDKVSEIPEIYESMKTQKISRRIPGKLICFLRQNVMLQSKNLYFYFYKNKATQGKFREKFLWNFRNYKKLWKIAMEISRKFSGNFPENRDVFQVEMQCYRAEITIFIFIKVRKLGENFVGNFREIS